MAGPKIFFAIDSTGLFCALMPSALRGLSAAIAWAAIGDLVAGASTRGLANAMARTQPPTQAWGPALIETAHTGVSDPFALSR